MASLKVFVFVLLATLFTSQVESASIGLGDDGIIDILKNVIQKIEELVDDILPQIKEIVDGIDDDFDKAQAQIVKIVSDLADLIISRLVGILNDIGKQSSPAGQQLAKCVNASESAFVGVLASLAQDFTTCTKVDLVKVATAASPLVNDLISLWGEAKTILKGIDKCQGNDVGAILCVAQVAGDLVSKVGPKLIDDLTKEIPAIITAGEAFGASSVQCWNSGKATLLSNAAKVLDQVAACAAA